MEKTSVSTIPNQTLSEYARELFGGEDELLRTLRAEATERGLPGIQVPLELGRLLQLLIVQTRARRVLEIGTLFGYSAIVMARVLSDGRLITLEVDRQRAELAKHNFERAGVADRVDVRVGSALDVLPTLEEATFDLVFIDADKESYSEYLRWALRLTRPGSVIVADNIWRGGSVVAPDSDDIQNRAVAEFSREIAENPSLISVIVPRLDLSDAASVSVVRAETL